METTIHYCDIIIKYIQNVPVLPDTDRDVTMETTIHYCDIKYIQQNVPVLPDTDVAMETTIHYCDIIK